MCLEVVQKVKTHKFSACSNSEQQHTSFFNINHLFLWSICFHCRIVLVSASLTLNLLLMNSSVFIHHKNINFNMMLIDFGWYAIMQFIIVSLVGILWCNKFAMLNTIFILAFVSCEGIF